MGEIIDNAKGKIKQVAGTLTSKDKLKADGELDELKGIASENARQLAAPSDWISCQGQASGGTHKARGQGCSEVAAIAAFSNSHT
jgi:hypothetical protein